MKVTSIPAGGSSSFGDANEVPKFALVDAQRHAQVDVIDSTDLQTISFGGVKYTLRMVTVGNYDYIGEAAIGTAASAAFWRIKRIDNTSGIVITWAGTGGFDQVWWDIMV